MGGRELDQRGLTFSPLTRQQLRAAAVHVADRVAAENPHPLDDLMPRLAGRLIAEDPAVRSQVRELLDALGLNSKEQQ
jgi:hypothetical protein